MTLDLRQHIADCRKSANDVRFSYGAHNVSAEERATRLLMTADALEALLDSPGDGAAAAVPRDQQVLRAAFTEQFGAHALLYDDTCKDAMSDIDFADMCVLALGDAGAVILWPSRPEPAAFDADDADDFIRLHTCGFFHRKIEDCPSLPSSPGSES